MTTGPHELYRLSRRLAAGTGPEPAIEQQIRCLTERPLWDFDQSVLAYVAGTDDESRHKCARSLRCLARYLERK